MYWYLVMILVHVKRVDSILLLNLSTDSFIRRRFTGRRRRLPYVSKWSSDIKYQRHPETPLILNRVVVRLFVILEVIEVYL